jgi:hypothetical protein
VSSPIEVTIGPAPTFSLVGIPGQLTAAQVADLRMPPCPACGQEIEVQLIDVSLFGRAESMFVPGPWSCPSECHPAYRRFVVAPTYRDFQDVCRESGWNHHRVLYISDDGRNEHVLRGRELHPGMLCFSDRSSPHPRLAEMIRSRAATFEVRRTGGDAFLAESPEPGGRLLPPGDEELPWSGRMVSADVPASGTIDDFPWRDSARWTPETDNLPRYGF